MTGRFEKRVSKNQAISMAAGEYVSVSSQADVESSDRLREQRVHAEEPEEERIARLKNLPPRPPFKPSGIPPELMSSFSHFALLLRKNNTL